MTPIEKDPSRGLNGALAAEIRSELAVRQLSQTWLSEASGIERLTLRRYLNGERQINTAVAESIAQALDLDPSDLMVRAVSRRDADPFHYGPATINIDELVRWALLRGRHDVGAALNEIERLWSMKRMTDADLQNARSLLLAGGGYEDSPSPGVADLAARDED